MVAAADGDEGGSARWGGGLGRGRSCAREGTATVGRGGEGAGLGEGTARSGGEEGGAVSRWRRGGGGGRCARGGDGRVGPVRDRKSVV